MAQVTPKKECTTIRIRMDIRDALNAYVQPRGIKQQFFVEKLIKSAIKFVEKEAH